MSTTEKIVTMLRDRSAVGLDKYGVSIDRNDLAFDEWCQHAIEEMLDGAQYLQRAKDVYNEADKLVKPLNYASFLRLCRDPEKWRYGDEVTPKQLLDIYKKLVVNGYISEKGKSGE
jgi:hypothetical protein